MFTSTRVSGIGIRSNVIRNRMVKCRVVRRKVFESRVIRKKQLRAEW